MMFDEICENHRDDDCWGCPFRDMRARNKTCREWVEENGTEAWGIAQRYIANGNCIVDRSNLPYVGKLPDGQYQQLCYRCFTIHVIDKSAVFKDEYVDKLAYICPTCKQLNTLKKQR